MTASVVYENSENMKQTISLELSNGFCHTGACIEFLEGTKQIRDSIPRNSCVTRAYAVCHVRKCILSIF